MLILISEDRLAQICRRVGDNTAKQASHNNNPLRLGGAAVVASIFLGFFVGIKPEEGFTLGPILLSVLPAFVAGFSEDVGYRISAKGRLAAAFFSAMIAVILLRDFPARADILGLDWAMTIPAFSIAITIIFSAGFCHAVNLIDGMNGLAGAVVLSAAAGGYFIANQAAQPELAWIFFALTAATAGFIILNWPIARLFLGDAGAYTLGHLVVWPTMLLAARSSDVAVPALLLILFWPLADVSHTIVRRILRGAPISSPDRSHLHQKVRRMLDIMFFAHNRRAVSNPLTTLMLLPFIVAPVATGAILWNHPGGAWIALGVYMAGFSAAHPLTIWLSWKHRKRMACTLRSETT